MPTRVQEPTSMADLLASQEKPLVSIRRRQVVEATVLHLSPTEIIFDLGAKAEGIVSGRERHSEAAENLKVGDTVQVSILESDSDSNYIVCSLKTFAENRKYNQVKEVLEESSTIEVKVVEERKGGYLVHYNGIRGFLPLSQVSLEYMGKAKDLLNKSVQVKVIEFDQDIPRLIVSQKAIVSPDQQKTRDRFFDKTNIGSEVTGKVVAVLPFGIVVDLGGIEGFVHISEIAWERVDNPQNYYKMGDSLTGTVLNLDQEEGKVILSVKQLTESPWSKIDKLYKVDQTVDGIVSKTTPFGVLVRLEDGIMGLVPKAKLPADKTFADGDQVQCIIEAIDVEKKRINLALSTAQ